MRERKSNFELLRILSVVLIIGHHFAVHSGYYFTTHEVTGNMLFLQLLSVGGKIGVNLFVMLAGYFLVAGKDFRLEKAVKLWLQVFFYSLVLFFLACALGALKCTPKGVLGALFPVVSNVWWFVRPYLLMYLLTPLLNRWLVGLEKKWYRRLLLCLAVFWYLIPILAWLPGQLRELAWFVFLYFLAGYLRLHGEALAGKWHRWLALGVVCFLVTYGWAVVMLKMLASRGGTYELAYLDAHHILILLTSCFLFLGVSGWELGSRPRINMLASLSFGIYLLHDSDYLRYWLWRRLLKGALLIDRPVLLLYGLGAVAAVFLICGLLEYLRIITLDGLFAKGAEKLCLLPGRGRRKKAG